jgi:hypothetical protein
LLRKKGGLLGVFPRHFWCFMSVLDRCYFIRLVVFWLSYAKVSIRRKYKKLYDKNRQAWYALSDEALEKQIARDLMFRRFIDLSLSEAVPDHSTIWRFRRVFFQDILSVLWLF